MLYVLGTRYEHLVIPELDPALENRPALVVLTPVESDVIDLLLITRLLRIVLDMLAGDLICWQAIRYEGSSLAICCPPVSVSTLK